MAESEWIEEPGYPRISRRGLRAAVEIWERGERQSERAQAKRREAHERMIAHHPLGWPTGA